MLRAHGAQEPQVFDANDDGQHPPEPSSDAGVRSTTNVTHASFLGPFRLTVDLAPSGA
jgi:hypothetical protein